MLPSSLNSQHFWASRQVHRAEAAPLAPEKVPRQQCRGWKWSVCLSTDHQDVTSGPGKYEMYISNICLTDICSKQLILVATMNNQNWLTFLEETYEFCCISLPLSCGKSLVLFPCCTKSKCKTNSVTCTILSEYNLIYLWVIISRLIFLLITTESTMAASHFLIIFYLFVCFFCTCLPVRKNIILNKGIMQSFFMMHSQTRVRDGILFKTRKSSIRSCK